MYRPCQCQDGETRCRVTKQTTPDHELDWGSQLAHLGDSPCRVGMPSLWLEPPQMPSFSDSGSGRDTKELRRAVGLGPRKSHSQICLQQGLQVLLTG